jgi:hypothetical protein
MTNRVDGNAAAEILSELFVPDLTVARIALRRFPDELRESHQW